MKSSEGKKRRSMRTDHTDQQLDHAMYAKHAHKERIELERILVIPIKSTLCKVCKLEGVKKKFTR